IIVDRLRTATANQSILLTMGAGRQVTNLLAILAREEKPDDQDRIILPWDKLISSIAFYIGLDDEQVSDVVNNLVSTNLGKGDLRENIGRVFIVEDPEKLYQFAEYCRERHMIEAGHTKEMSEQFSLKNDEELELLMVIGEIVEEEGALEDFPAATLEKRLEERYKKPLTDFQPTIERFGQTGLLESFHPEGSDPAYRINNRDLLKEKLGKIELLAELRELDKKIMK
ncbi:hypothetical protein ACFL4K_02500, partial [Candidatus Neomarinimicrobiota bacterium]